MKWHFYEGGKGRKDFFARGARFSTFSTFEDFILWFCELDLKESSILWFCDLDLRFKNN